MLFRSDDPAAIRKALVPNIASDTLFFVGDEKQSIYKFRGADVSVFNELKRDLARGEDEAELRGVQLPIVSGTAYEL